MRKNNKKFIIFLFLFSLLFLSLEFFEILKHPMYYSYDPYYHSQLSDYIVNNGFQPSFLENTIPKQIIPYETIFWSFFAIINLITNIPLLILFKISGAMFILLSGIILALSFNSNKTRAIILLLFLFSEYIFWRGLITYTENMVILFISILIFAIRKNNILLVYLSYLFCIATHYRSWIIPTSLLLYFIIKDSKNIISKITYFLITLVAGIPFLVRYIPEIKGYFSYHFGSFENIVLVEQDVSRYAPISWLDFISNISLVLIIIYIFNIFVIIKQKEKKSILLLFLPLPALLLLKGEIFNIYLPYYRMYSYLIILTIATLSFSDFNINKIISKKYLLIVFVIITFIISMIGLISIKGATIITQEDIYLSEKLDSINENKLIISKTPELLGLGTKYILDDKILINKIYNNPYITSQQLFTQLGNYSSDFESIYIISERENFINDIEYEMKYKERFVFRLEKSFEY